MSICSNILFLRLLYFAQVTLQIMRFVIPIGLIVKIAMDMYKSMIIGDFENQRENVNNSIRRIVASIIVFLVPTMVNLVIGVIESSTGKLYDYKGCLNDIENINYYIELKKQQDELKEFEEKENSLKEYEKYKEASIELIKNNLSREEPEVEVTPEPAPSTPTPSTPTPSNPTSSKPTPVRVLKKEVGNKYNLSEEQLKDLARICEKEQGSAKGASWEAALMANRYELYGASFGNLYNYVMKSGWWAPANSGSYKSVNLDNSVYSSVRSVLIDGQRPISLYVDEHDWTGDLKKLSTNGKDLYNSFNNKKNYQVNSTVIYNKYGAVYTYYGHADENSDPFGYTNQAKNLVNSLSSKI